MAGPTDADILEIGRSIRDALPAASRSPLKALDAKAMDLATADADLRAALFRSSTSCPPAAPSTTSSRTSPASSTRSTSARHRSTPRCAWAPAAPAARRSGAPPPPASPHGAPLHHRRLRHDATRPLAGLWRDGIASSVDLLGEATVTPAEAEGYAARCANEFEVLTAVYRPLPERPLLEHDAAGPVPRGTCP